MNQNPKHPSHPIFKPLPVQTHLRRWLWLWPGICLAAAELAGCGGGSTSADNSTQSTQSTQVGGVFDTTLPFVTHIEPGNNAVGIEIVPRLLVNFSEEMNADSLNRANITLTQAGAPVEGTLTLARASVSFTPATALKYNTVYTMRVSKNVTDLAGNGLSGNEGIITPNDFVWQFTTSATPFPSTYP